MRASAHPILLFSACAALVACPSPGDEPVEPPAPPPPMAPAPEPPVPTSDDAPPASPPAEREHRTSDVSSPDPGATAVDEADVELATERPANDDRAHPPSDETDDDPGLPRVGNPYALPRGGAVADAAQRVETTRQLVDGLGQAALLHASRMSGDQPDITGSTDVDYDAEKRSYLDRLRATHRRMRELMHAVARCPDADPDRPVANRSAPVNELAAEIERYDGARATATQADAHVERLRPLVVRWKSVYIDPDTAQRASEADWSPPRDLVANWCP